MRVNEKFGIFGQCEQKTQIVIKKWADKKSSVAHNLKSIIYKWNWQENLMLLLKMKTERERVYENDCECETEAHNKRTNQVKNCTFSFHLIQLLLFLMYSYMFRQKVRPFLFFLRMKLQRKNAWAVRSNSKWKTKKGRFYSGGRFCWFLSSWSSEIVLSLITCN